MTVEWRPVSGYVGSYAVSSDGQIRGEERRVQHGDHHITVRARVLRPATDRKGYLYVALRKNGRMRTVKVHSLVAQAFLGERTDGQVIRHVDGNSLNNAVSNLPYGTYSENNYDMVSHGTHWQTRKRSCPRGHLLAQWNLVASEAERSRRGCLSCARARAYIQHHSLPKSHQQAVSDRYYQETSTKEMQHAHSR